MKELIYMDFLNNYLLQNRVKEIKITKNMYKVVEGLGLIVHLTKIK